MNKKRNHRDIPLWKNVTEEQWQDWKWQISNRITTIDQLEQVVNLTQEEREGVKASLKKLRMAITPYRDERVCLIPQTNVRISKRKQVL